MNNLSLKEHSFKKLISDPDNNIAKPFTIDVGFFRSFENLELDEEINFNSEDNYSKPIVLNGCSFKKINIEGSIFLEFLWFKNCVFNHDFIIYEGDFKSILFENCEFKEGLTIHNIKTDSLSIELSASKNPIRIKGGIYKRLFYNSANEKTHLKVNGQFTFIDLLSIDTIIGATITISESIIRLLKLEGDFNNSSRINIKNIKNLDISLDNINNDGKLYFTDFETYNIIGLKIPPLEKVIESINDKETKLEINHLIKYNPKIKTFLQLFNHISLRESYKNLLYALLFRDVFIIKIDSQEPNFVINYSSLGLLELKGMQLEKYRIIIMSSDLSSIKLINTTFPTNKVAWTYADGFSVFNDLYTSANKQNNTEDKIEYYKASQKYLYKKIKSKKILIKPNYSTLKALINKLSSIMAIKISGLYSNHGSNWIRSVLITVLLIGMPLFGLFAASLKDIRYEFSSKGINFFIKDILPHFPEFINPLHRIDFMDIVSDKGPWSGLVDLIARILIGIGIFEMIRSFRKYVRT